MRLSKLVRSVRGCQVVYDGQWERDIQELTMDSRQVRFGALFFCLVGGNLDGHAYATDAVKRGAVAVVCERKLDISEPPL